MAANPQYVAEPTVDIAQVSAANTLRDGTGTIVTVATGPVVAAGAGVGKRVSRVLIHRPGTNSATIVTFFYSPDGGTTNRIIAEVAVPAYTASTTSAQTYVDVPQLIGFIIPGAAANTPCLRAATTVATTLNVIVEGGIL